MKYDGSDSTKAEYTYDNLNRITNRTVTNGASYSTDYTYVSDSTANSTTPLIQSITQGSGANAFNFAYTYDNRGNITSETRNGVTVTYEYDQIGQLIRVNDPNDTTASETGTTWLYTYDRGGNILSKAAYAYTTDTVGTAERVWQYVYGDGNWKDKLTSFDGHTITYDSIGNPLNDGTWTYEWQAGRQLKSMTNAVTGVTLEFTYNNTGLRTRKVKKVNGDVVETTTYIWNGKQVVSLIKGNDTMHFYYDAQGRLSMVKHNDSIYTYVHNLQNDVIGMLDMAGTLAVEYRYDACGQPLTESSEPISRLNPFRYRGYLFDEETGYYYLQHRYYSSISMRYINSNSRFDKAAKNAGHNLYTYVMNNPAMYVDADGRDCYIFYEESTSWTIDSDYKEAEKYFGTGRVHKFLVGSSNDFVKMWSEMGKNGETVDAILIDLHGAPQELDLGINFDVIDSLENEYIDHIGGIVLSSCNSAHLSYAEDNVASHFAMIADGANVIASDGTVYRRQKKFLWFRRYYYRSSEADETYKYYSTSYSKMNLGWFRYYKENDRVYFRQINNKKFIYNMQLSELFDQL